MSNLSKTTKSFIILTLVVIFVQIIIFLNSTETTSNLKYSVSQNYSFSSKFLNIFTKTNCDNSTSPKSKWFLTRLSLESDGESEPYLKSRVDFLLKLRKYLYFGLYRINSILRSENAFSQWWANVLSIYEFHEELMSQNDTFSIYNYKLVLKVQPGEIPFEITLQVSYKKNYEILEDRTGVMEFISAQRLQTELPHCPGLKNINLRKMCLCENEKYWAESKSLEARSIWNNTDRELFSWLPDKKVLPIEYIEFYNMSLYTLSPISTDFFGDNEVKMILFISSAPGHFTQRKTIRDTFGNINYLRKHNVRLLFLFGQITDEITQRKINEEFKIHDDIVQSNYSDSYHNLTLSHLSMYNWVITKCGESNMPKWVLKSDDDFFFNIPLAIKVAEANPRVKIAGCLYCGTKAIRDIAYERKYYVPRYMYSPLYYAGYLSGVAYFFNTKIIRGFLEASKLTPIIHMDDAYITGLLPREVGVEPMSSKQFTYGRSNLDPCSIKLMVSSYVFNSSDMILQWDEFNKPIPANCSTESIKNLTIQPLTPYEKKWCFYE